MSRQNYYAMRKLRSHRSVDEGLILHLVKLERLQQPRIGGKKLLHMIGDELEEHNVKIGRDRFFKILAEHGLLVEPKPGQMRTTNSRHSLPVFNNLVSGVVPKAPNEIWVSDLTYIRTDEGFMFASVIMDRFSRKLVGRHIGDTLETEGCLAALDGALAGLPSALHPIHHSDRGSQYCSHLYVNRLRSRDLGISMTQEMHCYENGAAERVIGILKQEYNLDWTFNTKALAARAFEQAVYQYNNRRPHMALGYRIPAQVHARAA
jgi:transposase InsO family protein